MDEQMDTCEILEFSWQKFKIWHSVQLDFLASVYLFVLKNTVTQLCILLTAVCPCPDVVQQK